MVDESRPNSTLLLDYWKPVVGYETTHEVSITGRVRSTRRDRFLKPQVKQNGYLTVGLCRDRDSTPKLIHRLVMAAFCGPCPEAYEVNHKSARKRDNHRSNLEYVTREGNSAHAQRAGLVKRLTKEQVAEIRALEGKMTRKAIARHMGLCDWTVRMVHWGVTHADGALDHPVIGRKPQSPLEAAALAVHKRLHRDKVYAERIDFERDFRGCVDLAREAVRAYLIEQQFTGRSRRKATMGI